jgi:hypothetical protein
MTRRLLWALAVLAVVAGAIAANFALLGYAQERDEPVGRLSPRSAGVAASSSARPRTTTAAAQTSGTTQREHSRSHDHHDGRSADD